MIDTASLAAPRGKDAPVRLPAKKQLPAALALAAITLLGTLAATAAATPSGGAAPAQPASFSPYPTTSWYYPTGPWSSSTYPTTVPSTTVPSTTTTVLPTTTVPPSTSPTWFTPSENIPPPQPGEDYARGGTAIASSSDMAPGLIIDGNPDTAWSPAIGRKTTDTPEWVYVRWLHYREVSRVVVHTSLRDFDIQVLNQYEQWWDTVMTVNYANTTTFTALFTPRIARGVRIVAKVGPPGHPNLVRVNEIQAYTS
ncbi:hypothetical protein JOD54_005754 [Actinokineospora baliensis]|uniref:discoidin domain-containing protein n=1 Tax=Actinokineospora baliensis TaxID=547056 RepID=UPI001958A59F|nr:discoidin domain-containing protein [Actinokineospora baliensis]MBM7775550.1 hypothetical protein [Actinokineospora baliensis]